MTQSSLSVTTSDLPSPVLVGLPKPRAQWRHKHLLGLEDLTAEEITYLLDCAEALHQATNQGRTKLDLLRGRT
ncbi:MAG: hypothetical protein ACK5T6_18005, partial [Pirellula sp.]